MREGASMAAAGDVLEQLMAVIEDRREHPPERSYTTSLFRGGVEKIGGKILEEAREVVEAAAEPADEQQRQHLIHEAGDLLYHLLVLLGHQRIALTEVSAELARRFGTSGLDEKASRTQGRGG
jgi:phosphoribosyl-ATP pyrophosphohydrolase